MPLPAPLSGASVHLVGIKGTGMSAFAEVLVHRGAAVSGSDVAEVFYTDRLLSAIGITPAVGFDATHLPQAVDAVIYSAAYDPATNPELVAAASRGIPILSYSEALGALSEEARALGNPSVAVAGVHGKTSTTALLGTLLKELRLPATVVVGSAVTSFGGSATFVGGSEMLVAETCEYRRNFLSFSPSVLLLTSVEADHLDYFRDYEDVRAAFVEFGTRLSPGGLVVYCTDDAGAKEAVDRLCARRDDIRTVRYGFAEEADFSIRDYQMVPGCGPGLPAGAQRFRVVPIDAEFELHVPGRHMVQNAAGALAVLLSAGLSGEATANGLSLSEGLVSRLVSGLGRYGGSTRRSEHLGIASGIQFVDDYGHHPSAIRKTLEAYREFYGARRLIVDFMSHTYSRTAALLDEFATCFDAADVVILHKIYASAREQYNGTIAGKDLAEAVGRHHPDTHFFPEVMDAMSFCKELLAEGDLFVTLGAGNNWALGRELFEYFSNKVVHSI